MRISLIIFSLTLCLMACENKKTPVPEAPVSQEPIVVTPGPQQQSPVPYNTDSPSLLRDLVRNTIRDELHYTVPETNGTTKAKKSHSFDVGENNGRPTWEIKIRWHDAATDKLYSGGDYLLLWEVVDPNKIDIVNSPDGKLTALRIRPKDGNTFLYNPYTNDPSVPVHEALIGWFDHSQDATILRAYTYMKKLAENMGKL